MALLLSSIFTLMPVQAQQKQNPSITGGPLPSGVTPPSVTIDGRIFLSFSPNPIGKGQTLLINVWSIPAPGTNRAHTGYTVTITKPDGTKDVVGPFNSFVADGTNWFEYVPDQTGNWTLQFTYPGDYYPAGRYLNGVLNNSAPASNNPLMDTRDYPATWYKPAQTPVQTLTVQDQQVMSWSSSPAPTDYWTRPISPENRMWYTIGGNFPYAYYNSFCHYAGPFVQAPNTPHIVWRTQEAVSGIIGGEAGQYSIQSQPGTPSVIYLGRCYQTLTVPYNGIPTSCAICYDLRTGEQYYTIPVSQGGITPTALSYNAPATSNSQDLGTAAGGFTVDLISLTGGRLYKIDPYTGAATLNVSIAPLTTGTFYNNNYMISVQTINATAGQFRLINWTTAGSSAAISARIVGNVSWPVSMAPGGQGMLADFDTGVAVGTTAGIFGSSSNGTAVTGDFGLAQGAYGTRIVGVSLITGQVLYNFTTEHTSFNPGADSVYGGKIFIPMDMGFLDCYDLLTGKLVWSSTQLDYPWGAFGGYNAESAYGLYYWQTYDGVVAFNCTTGDRVWKYQAPSTPFENPYTMPNGTSEYSFFGVAWVADGKIYAYNSEHTPSQPITRGWGLHCIDAYTGKGIWNITGSMQPGAMADGYLTAGNSYDGYMYVFGKGQSTTTVTAPDVAVPKGNGVVIKGTVLDQSPCQPGTPCVSENSMSTQMEYLHMQHPIDGINHNITMTGVPVTLTAIDEKGAYINIGTATTDAYYGTFEMAWTPPAEGTYRIIASFAGDDSYGSSGASTAISVGPAPATPAPTASPPAAAVDYMPTLEGILAAVVVAIVVSVIALTVVLRKH